MEESIFKQDAKTMVDAAFNNKLFKDDITRDDMNAFEELIGFLLQSRFDSYKKIDALMTKIDKSKLNPNKQTNGK